MSEYYIAACITYSLVWIFSKYIAFIKHIPKVVNKPLCQNLVKTFNGRTEKHCPRNLNILKGQNTVPQCRDVLKPFSFINTGLFFSISV